MAKHVLIIGGGPAGCSAAMTLRLRGEDVTILYSGEGALGRAKRVDNYPGLAQMRGGEMLSAFRRQAEEMGAALRPGVARYIQRTRRGFTVLAGEDMIACDAVLLASGVARVNLIPGEEALVGRGVSYCATCDGMLYRGKAVAVLGYTDTARKEADFLRGLGCSVTYFNNPRTCEIRGDGQVSSVTCDGETAQVEGVFILRPTAAPGDLFPGLTLENGYVAVDRKMATNLPGLFAAGDCTGGPLQVSKAAGEGLIAGQSAAAYVADLLRAEKKQG